MPMLLMSRRCNLRRGVLTTLATNVALVYFPPRTPWPNRHPDLCKRARAPAQFLPGGGPKIPSRPNWLFLLESLTLVIW
ncbi:uncharacterized protein CLUP02_04873 [Colletotrichum lupini]|uniref:Uncharacterized protein n=1 Tax=Colletotrichum lupini TaxID=145971 RepID=A0A9Q8SL66_9PEZI|nr:uncharacterized protein CLUP02_04873 [Colletotrichum lupini]UQC79394.1 hypothetical protein CLUP02_04873 [Colletotrichum lupini]